MLNAVKFVITLSAISSLCIVSIALFFIPLRDALILNGEWQGLIILWGIWTRVYAVINRFKVSFSNNDSFNNQKTHYSSMFSDANSSSMPSSNFMTDPSYSYMSQNIHNHTSTSIWNSSTNSLDR